MEGRNADQAIMPELTSSNPAHLATTEVLPASAEAWGQFLTNSLRDRCDLDVLLKDDWRHKVPVRDEAAPTARCDEQTLTLEKESYAALQVLLQGPQRFSVGTFALFVLHCVLGAYGHGRHTVIALVAHCGGASGEGPRVLPTVVDHVAQSERNGIQGLQAIEGELRRDDAWGTPTELLSRGLFDAVLMLDQSDGGAAEVPPCPLVVIVREDENRRCLDWRLIYNTELFEPKVMAGMLDVTRELTAKLVRAPTQRTGDLELISDQQKEQLELWNATDGAFPSDMRLEELFEQAVARSPNAEAVVCGDYRFTYREINERCNQFAHWLLRRAEVRPEELVAFYLDRSYLGVVVTFGLWKAGAAYTALDPSYPVDRILFTLSDTGANKIITNRHYVERLRTALAGHLTNVQIIEIESVMEATEVRTLPSHDPRLGLGSRRVAYLTYTSGTTGVPKGVPKEHRSVVNSITDLSDRYDMRREGEERVALFAAYVFEPFMRQTLIALINSQALVVVPDNVRLDPLRFPAFVAQHGITYLSGTGSVLRSFDLRSCPSLKKMLLVGEELTSSGLRLIRDKFEGWIINEYAFTETAFVTAIKAFPPGVSTRSDRSIGRPLRNVKCYLVSRNLKRVPIEAIGELYIGGVGVARGYLNRDTLTAERFLPNPFQTEHERRTGENASIYRTGDLARMLPGGEIDFMGRDDFQVKLNGIRVEPGEIEAHALEYPGVQQCVVIPRDGPGGLGDRYLVGYFVAAADCEVTEHDLRAFLAARLIRIMVPARMVRLSRFSMNVNGKVDRRALPEVSVLTATTHHSAWADGATTASAITSVAADLRDIWSSVLGVPVEDLGFNGDFFMLGGHSISCIQLIARVWEKLRLVLSVEDVFALKTLGAMATHLAQRLPESPRNAHPIAPETKARGGVPLALRANGLQLGLMYHALKKATGDDAYVMQSVYIYRAPIDSNLLQQAWRYARQKYPSLRLRFEWVAEELRQIVDVGDEPLDFRFEDVSAVGDDASRQARVRELQEHDRTEPYSLEAGPLFRVYLVKHREDSYSLIFSCHHIILDGWSVPLLLREVNRIYLNLVNGRAVELVADTAYIEAQRYWEAHRDDHVEYWTQEFERITDRGDFNGLLNARSRYTVELNRYDHVRDHRTRALSIDRSQLASLKTACAAGGLTLHSVLQFVWHKVLHAFGGARTTVVGTVVSGRNLPVDGIETSVGMFINTLPLIVDHDDQETRTVSAAIAELQEAANRMNSRSTTELARLHSGQLKHTMFDTLLVLENYPRLWSDRETLQQEKVLPFIHQYDADKVDYPLACVAREESGALKLVLWYAGELFDDQAIDTVLGTVRTLFDQVAEDLERPVRDLEYLSPDTTAKLETWNRTEAPLPDHMTLHAKFEQAAIEWPDAVAVVSGAVQLTYAELNARANRVAQWLLFAVTLAPDDLVGIVMDKSERMIAALLAVWKAGAAYVPIDPDYPDDRVAFMLDDTGARLVVTDERYRERLRRLTGATVVSVDQIPVDGLPCNNPTTTATAQNLAYAIYTSGTTGRPKAVLVEHRGVLNLHASLERLFSLRRGSIEEAILSFSNYVFDHFVEQMTDALLSGQKLVVLDDALRTDKAQLYQYMNDHQVTYLSGTPSVLSLYEFASVPSLTRIDAIGEEFTTPVFDRIRTTFDGMIINGYGPTEISITSHKRPYRRGEPRTDRSIGSPMANTKCYVLNARQRRVPIGAAGELYIGGVGVARGYLNRERLTAERFLANPFQTASDRATGTNARIYRTGDLVRWLPNGELDYLGRSDLQIKIRGQRVELGEIEAVLSSYPGITRSIVVARDRPGGTSSKYLVGFYLSDRMLEEQDILRWTSGRLPQALVPARVLHLDEIPVTKSGKLDLSRLPDTDPAAGPGVDYVAPSGDVEVQLCQIWSQVLGIAAERISLHDDFFYLGGDSLRAIRLAQAVNAKLGHVLNLASVFKRRTIEGQAKYIRDGVGTYGDAISPVGIAATVIDPPVSLAQERLLFIDDFVGGTPAYNIPFVVEAHIGLMITHDAIISALRALVQRHAALRTLLRGETGGVRSQLILDEATANSRLTTAATIAASVSELDACLRREAAHVFRLDQELPIRAALFGVVGVADKLYLSVVVHHSCFDGESWNVFRRELSALVSGAPVSTLGTPGASYADFAVWQRRRLSGGRLNALMAYWAGALAGFAPLELPLDHPRPRQFDYRGRELAFELDKTVLNQLRLLARAAEQSLFSVLLGAFCLMLETYSGQHDLVVGAPSANRGHPDLENIVGVFTNLVALRVRVDRTATLVDYLRAVGQVVVDSQIHGEMPFERLVRLLQVNKDPSRHPVVQVVLNLLSEEPAWPDGLGMKSYTPDHGGWTTAKFDLSATLFVCQSGLRGNFTFAASLFDDTSVRQMLATLMHILTEFGAYSNEPATKRVSDVSRMDDGTRIRLLGEAAEARAPLPGRSEPARTLHGVFEDVVACCPNALAVVHGRVEMSYRSLNARANELAHRLRATSAIGSDDLVALLMDKSERMVIAILAVWKAGAAYVPIDPDCPDARVALLLDDAQAKLVVTDDIHAARLNRLMRDTALTVVSVERTSEAWPECGNPYTETTGAGLAYAIYTSGTTGRPKAVTVRHRNAVALRDDLVARYFRDNRREVVLFQANYTFDFSIEQILLSILSGHTLLVPSSLPALDEEFYELANHHRLTYLSGTPTQICQLDLARLAHLRLVLVAGEPFKAHHFDRIRLGYIGPLLNAYGTTETTVYNTLRRFEPGEPWKNTIGAPLSHTRLYVLDHDLKPVPVGAIGELFIAGDCVSAGYLARPELTRERFLSNPFRSDAERDSDEFSVLYRTGDLVRKRLDGELEYWGRNDAQVKINGLRIEPGEVEAVLASCPGVRQCAVIAQDNFRAPGGPTRLVGYYVEELGASISADALLAKLRTQLAPGMVPALLVRVEGALPVTLNGKLDLRALPEPALGPRPDTSIAPRSRLESRLCQIWRRVLQRAAIGIDDDFFQSGGDSITALELASSLQRELERKVSVKQVFDYPTVRAFATHVRGTVSEALNTAQPQPPRGEWPMLPVQEWLFAKPLARRDYFNQHFAIRTPALAIERLRTAIDRLVDHHDAFRLRFRTTGEKGPGSIKQFYCDASPPLALHELDVAQLGPEEITARLEAWQSGFDVEHGPVACAAYLYGFADGTARVWFAQHHLITDAVSWRILARDLETQYHGGDLGPRGTSYGEWAQALRKYVPWPHEPGLWEELASAVAAEANAWLPISVVSNVQSARFELPRLETHALLAAGHWVHGGHTTDLLLAALALALRDLTGKPINYVTVESHGRDGWRGAPDVRDTVGWFTSMHPLALRVADDDLDRSIALAREARQLIPSQGIGYGVLRGTYGTGRAPLAPVSFNYLGRLGGPAPSAGPAQQPDPQWHLDAALCGASRSTADEAIRDGVIDVTMSCVDEGLVVYVHARLEAEASQRLVSALHDGLTAIAQHVLKHASRRGAGTSAVASAGPRWRDDLEDYILVNERETEKTLFVLPPGEGGAESYLNNVARRLPGMRLVLFNNVHLRQPMPSFEALAKYYLAHVREMQSSGPYSLLGWSFGGVLALEMALQLAAEGETVANVFFIDSFFNVRKACTELGIPEGTELLDPVHHEYKPSERSLARLRSSPANLVLFKATPGNSEVIESDRQRLFDYYARSHSNNLDTLFEPSSYTVESIGAGTHFSWVHDKVLVGEICAQIRASLNRPPQALGRHEYTRPVLTKPPSIWGES